jgi:hypothetical protein
MDLLIHLGRWVAGIAFVLFVLHLAASTGRPNSATRGAGRGALGNAFMRGAGQAILEAQTLVEPDKRHLADELRKRRVAEDDEAAPEGA